MSAQVPEACQPYPLKILLVSVLEENITQNLSIIPTDFNVTEVGLTVSLIVQAYFRRDASYIIAVSATNDAGHGPISEKFQLCKFCVTKCSMK